MWRRSLTSWSNYSFLVLSVPIKYTQILYPVQKILNYQKYSTRIYEETEAGSKELTSQDTNKFTYRTHTCGELRYQDVGRKVNLCGWVHYVRLSKFIIIRDAYGKTQCIFKVTDNTEFPLETVVKIEGTVSPRPTNMINREMLTGEIEVVIDNIETLNNVDLLPFNIRDYNKAKEALRLQHGYVALRFPETQSNLRNRSTMLHLMRRILVEKYNFVEVETPTLFCRTPGGAREFIVPTHHKGLFYSLVQSPQQFKQMLMAGSIDRYFQIARCYRDEHISPDRQPEFTQLDIELSFTSVNDVITLIEKLLYDTFIRELPKPPFKRITYRHALETYGSDKPNLQHSLELKNITKLLQDNKSELGFGAYVLPYSNKLGKLTTKYRQKIHQLCQKHKTIVLQYEDIPKKLGNDIFNKVSALIGEGNSCVLALGENDSVCLSLGELREDLAMLLNSKELLAFEDNMQPLWVVDFPLFVNGDDGLETCHHPFTSPHPDDIHLLDSEPLKVRALSYDLVLNGKEVGGGSIRIHKANLQEKILRMLNIDVNKLSHFLNTLKSGCPPHGGIALGIDRLIAIACNANSIREVIAFPKSSDGRDLLSGAPNEISEEDKIYYHINVRDE